MIIIKYKIKFKSKKYLYYMGTQDDCCDLLNTNAHAMDIDWIESDLTEWVREEYYKKS